MEPVSEGHRAFSVVPTAPSAGRPGHLPPLPAIRLVPPARYSRHGSFTRRNSEFSPNYTSSGKLHPLSYLMEITRFLAVRKVFVTTVVGSPPLVYERCLHLNVVLSCSNITQLLKGAVQSSARWLLLPPLVVDEALDHAPLPLDNHVLHAVPRHAGTLELAELFRVHRGAAVQRAPLAFWRRGEGLQMLPDHELRRLRSDLQGARLRVVFVHNPPFSVLKLNEKCSLDAHGFFPEVWITLGQQLNFTTVWALARNNEFGKRMVDYSWSGLMGQLVEGEVDAAVDVAITNARAEVIDFTEPISTSEVFVYARRSADPTSSHALRFARPLSQGVWAAAGALALATALVLAVGERAVRPAGGARAPPLYSPSGALLAAAAAVFCMQGQEAPARPLSSRMTLLFVYLTSTTLMAAYSGALVSSLAARRSQLPFSSYQEMLDAGSYTLAFKRNTSTRSFLENGFLYELRAVYEQAVTPHLSSLPHSDAEGFARVCQRPRYAYLAPASAQALLLREGAPPCDVAPVPGTALRKYLAIGLRKNSPYRRLLNRHIQRLRSSGIIRRLSYKLKPQYNIPPLDQEFKEVTISDVIPLILMLIIGISSGLILLVVENVVLRFTLKPLQLSLFCSN